MLLKIKGDNEQSTRLKYQDWRQTYMKCLIADDEPLILKDIHRTAKKVIGENTEYFLAENSDEALGILL